jgi:high-affinity iron transporter
VTGAGALLGIGAAVGLGIAIFRGGVRINLSRFFRITGFVLAIVAAGLLALGVHAAQEAGWTTALQSSAFDLTWLVAPGTVRASLLTGVLGLQPVPTVAEVVAWLLYAVPMGAYVLWPQRATPARTAVASPAT